LDCALAERATKPSKMKRKNLVIVIFIFFMKGANI